MIDAVTIYMYVLGGLLTGLTIYRWWEFLGIREYKLSGAISAGLGWFALGPILVLALAFGTLEQMGDRTFKKGSQGR